MYSDRKEWGESEGLVAELFLCFAEQDTFNTSPSLNDWKLNLTREVQRLFLLWTFT